MSTYENGNGASLEIIGIEAELDDDADELQRLRAENARLRAQLGRDTLTELCRLSELRSRWAPPRIARRMPFALIMLDLDGFKGVNDTHGHHVGDGLLLDVGRALRGCIRFLDEPFRRSGDEFVVALHDAYAAHTTAERIREAVEAVTHPLGAGCSLGVATFPEAGDTVDAVLRLADDRMYRDKGRRKR